jgi:hypothetical protein
MIAAEAAIVIPDLIRDPERQALPPGALILTVVRMTGQEASVE